MGGTGGDRVWSAEVVCCPCALHLLFKAFPAPNDDLLRGEAVLGAPLTKTKTIAVQCCHLFIPW